MAERKSATKIAEIHEQFVLDLAAHGKSTREIAAALAERGCNTTHVSVSRWLKKRRAERADVAKVVVREQLAKTLTGDLDRLETIRRQVAAKASRISKKPRQTFAWIKLKELEVKIIDRKLHYSGADDPGDEATATLAGLFAELERR